MIHLLRRVAMYQLRGAHRVPRIYCALCLLAIVGCSLDEYEVDACVTVRGVYAEYGSLIDAAAREISIEKIDVPEELISLERVRVVYDHPSEVVEGDGIYGPNVPEHYPQFAGSTNFNRILEYQKYGANSSGMNMGVNQELARQGIMRGWAETENAGRVDQLFINRYAKISDLVFERITIAIDYDVAIKKICADQNNRTD